MVERRSLRRPGPGMGPRNRMVEFDEALVIAVGDVLLVPAAADGAGGGGGEKTVHRRLGSVAKVLFGVLRGTRSRALTAVSTSRSASASSASNSASRASLAPAFNSATNCGRSGQQDRGRDTNQPHPDEMDRIGFQEILRQTHCLLAANLAGRKCSARFQCSAGLSRRRGFAGLRAQPRAAGRDA